MSGTIHNRAEASAWFEKHVTNAPKVGDMAPDFELWDAEGKESVRLSDLRGRSPVALVMGSFT